MSARIGEMVRSDGKILSYVHASTGGVELVNDEKFSLEPIAARNAAALLVRAADEVERMRQRIWHPEVSTSVAYETDFAVDPVKYPRVSSAHSLLAEELKDLLRDARADAVQYVKDVKADELRRAYERGKAEAGR